MTTAVAELSAHGISVTLPAAWEGRIALRANGLVAGSESVHGPQPAIRGTDTTSARRATAPGEVTYPVTHLANFALPADRGDFGSGAVDVMGAGHCLVALVEFGPESVGRALFATPGPPQPRPADFDPNTLQHRIPGQLGFQRFFTAAGRAFCVYVVLGAARNVVPLAGAARTVLAATRIEAR